MRPRHRHEEVQEVIPADYAGVLVTDRGRSDDARACDGVRQQKCLPHIQRSIREVLETTTGRARDFGEPLKGLLQGAIELWHAYRDLPLLRRQLDLRQRAQVVVAASLDKRVGLQGAQHAIHHVLQASYAVYSCLRPGHFV